MPLKYEKPSTGYMRELRAVSRVAKDFIEKIKILHVLPNDFPKQQLLDHCQALILLPEGTAGGSIVTLEAADADLTKIQQQHIPLPPEEDEPPSDELRSKIERGGELDRHLKDVTSAVRLAIECYKRESGDAIETDTSPEPSGGPNTEAERQKTTQNAAELEAKAHDLADDFDAIRAPDSKQADSLHRTIKDIEAQAIAAKGVLREAHPRPSVMTRLGNGLDKTASALASLGRGIQLGTDIGKDCNNTWSELQRQAVDGILTAIGTVGQGMQNIAKTIRTHRKNWHQEEASHFTAENFDYVEVYNRLLRGEPVPDAWAPFVDMIDLWQLRHGDNSHHLTQEQREMIVGDPTTFSDLTTLANCAALERLYLDHTQISNLTPLAHCTALKSLDLDNTQVSDLTPLAKCTALESLGLSKTQVSDLTPLANCAALEGLYLDNTQVSDLTPLAHCTALESFSLRNTQVSDLTPLKNCTSLKHLWIYSTKVTDISVLDHLKPQLEIFGP